MNIDRSVKERFERKILPVTESGCWLWDGCTEYAGYGTIKVSGKMKKAHRISYELYIGPIPDGMHVLHKCDVKSCVNPDHLFLGTHQDNMGDMRKKGRSPFGIDHYKTKLSEQEVREIRASTEMQKDLAVEYGVAGCTISAIKRGRTWGRVK